MPKLKTGLTIRRLEARDKHLLFDWANDRTTRENSLSTHEIDFDAHSDWFNAKLKDENAIYFIGEFQNQPFGLVRFDKKEENSVVGISIDKNFRGKGLATLLLGIACKEFRKFNTGNIVAFIKTGNIASIRTFEKSGFKYQGQTTTNGIELGVYIMEKDEL